MRLRRSRLSKQNGMNKNWHKHFSQPGETKIIQIHLYQFKLTESEAYFHHVVMNMCLVWRDQTDFSYTQKYIIPLTEPAPITVYFFHINTQLQSCS